MMFKRVLWFVSFALFIVFLLWVLNYVELERVGVTFSKCVDGDTAWFVIDGKETKVRFLAIDAPEIAHSGEEAEEYGNEASDYACSMLKKADNIELRYEQGDDAVDKYGRVLAWVFVDNKNLNELLVSKGYAQVKYVYRKYLYIDDLCYSQFKAYKKKIGIWSVEENDYSHNYCNKG